MDALLNFGYRLIDKVRVDPPIIMFLLNRPLQGQIPDSVLRPVIRMLCRQRIREITYGSFEAQHAAKMEWIEQVKARETIADLTDKANEQHYEVRHSLKSKCTAIYTLSSRCLQTSYSRALDLSQSIQPAYTPLAKKH